jgi:hypothetical protein
MAARLAREFIIELRCREKGEGCYEHFRRSVAANWGKSGFCHTAIRVKLWNVAAERYLGFWIEALERELTDAKFTNAKF